MKFGKIELRKEPLMLAPMEDVSDQVFRSLCKRFGADMLYTEFVSSDALIRSVEKTRAKLFFEEEERPVGIQLYGREVEALVEAAKIAEEAGPDFIDLNFGCPVKKIAMKGAGSGMLRDVPRLLEITEKVVKAVKLPVSVKTRLGWDEDSKIITTLAEQLQDVGIQALTIHGRTRSQMYTGEADWDLIGAVKNNPRIHIPIIGNGDVTSPEKARLYFDRYGVDGIMIGRGAIGRPWIFREIRHFLDTGELLPSPPVETHVDLVREQLRATIAWIGERRGILHSRRHLALTFKGLPRFRELKIQMLRSESQAEIETLLDRIAEEYAGFTAFAAPHSSDEQ